MPCVRDIAERSTSMLAFHLATFKVDATPPLGHPLCGGWIKPVVGVDDPLWLRGVVLLGGDRPIVLAALDWTGVMDESHRLWTEALADAAHTTPDRVALHCVHQHNAPFIDREGNALLRKAGADPLLYDEAFVDDLIKRSAAAVRESLTPAQPVTHIRVGRGRGQGGRLNRRVLGPERQDQVHPHQRHQGPAPRAPSPRERSTRCSTRSASSRTIVPWPASTTTRPTR